MLKTEPTSAGVKFDSVVGSASLTNGVLQSRAVAHVPTAHGWHMQNTNGTCEPWTEITVEPKQADLRFRYKCEGRSAGSLLGEGSNGEQKKFPTIKIHETNFTNAIVVVSCVSAEPPHYPHPHNLVGNDCNDGVCTVKVKGQNIVSFSNIGIQCVTKREVTESLKTRERLKVNPFNVIPPKDINTIELSSIRLCFQVFLPDANRKFTRVVPPVVSNQIFDKKTVHNLTICRLSRQAGSAQGGDEIFLLCEKITKDDIQVRFYEETEDGVCWESFGQFTPQQDVHRQFAIVVQTPPYKDQFIKSPVQVFLQLRRPSDDSTSAPKVFQYIPVDSDPYQIEVKRKRLNFEETFSIPTSVLPLTMKDDDVDEDSHLTPNPATATTTLKQNLKKKVERRMQHKEPVNATTASSSSSSAAPLQLPKYSFVNLQHAGESVAESDDVSVNIADHQLQQQQQQQQQQPVIFDDGCGNFFALALVNGQHQLVKLPDIGTDDRLSEAVNNARKPSVLANSVGPVDLSHN